MALCDRLVGRELAHLEHETPGIVAPVREAVGAREFELATRVCHGESLEHALAVTADDVARLGAFVAELDEAAEVSAWR